MQTSPGTTAPSSDVARFDTHTATIPDVISAGDPEILAPGEPDHPAETGWPVWDVQQIFTLPFYFMAKRYGDLWELDDEESSRVAQVWKPILDRYFPLDDTEWGTLLLVMAAILAPRAMMTDWKKGKEKKSTVPANTKTAASTGSPASSANGNQASQPEWEIFADKPTG